MQPQTTRASLLVRMRDTNDGGAWREFDAMYGELVLRYCRSRGLQLSDAEDVRQLVFMNLSRAMPRLEYKPEIGRFRDYLRRTVRNAIARHRIRHAAGAVGLDKDVLENVATDGDDANDAEWERQWTQQHCRLAMRTLRREGKPEHVDIFEQLLAGLSIDAIATARCITPAAVRKIKQRTKERLQGLIAHQLRREEGYD